MKTVNLFVSLILIGISLKTFAKEPVALEMSEWRPFVYMEDGKPMGIAYDIVKTLFERANIAYHFEIKPWARVYQNGLKKKNYFIPGLGRTLKREKLFHWICPLTKGTNIYFYKLKSNPIQINSLEEAKKYLVAVERGSYYQNFLETHFPQNKRQTVTQTDQLLKMLMAKRINFILLDEKIILKLSEKLGFDPNMFEKSLFAFNAQDYLVASINTDHALVVKLKKACMALKKENLINFN